MFPVKLGRVLVPSTVILAETGLRMCRPEKGQQIDAIRSRAVRSLQSALRTKFCEIRACFAYFAAKGGAVSLQFNWVAERDEFELSVPFCHTKPRHIRKFQITKSYQRHFAPNPKLEL
jgi:hypothetical protein